jgi:hypothetical protein
MPQTHSAVSVGSGGVAAVRSSSTNHQSLTHSLSREREKLHQKNNNNSTNTAQNWRLDNIYIIRVRTTARTQHTQLTLLSLLPMEKSRTEDARRTKPRVVCCCVKRVRRTVLYPTATLPNLSLPKITFFLLPESFEVILFFLARTIKHGFLLGSHTHNIS